MIVGLHLHGPPGEATRRLVSSLLEVVRQDNIYVVQAMLDAGIDVPDTMWEMGVVYDPPNPQRPVFDAHGRIVDVVDEVNTPQQNFYGISDILENGRFSCGDGAAAEAAIATVKHGIKTRCECVPQGGYEYHAIFITPDGPIDPSEHWLKMYEQSQGRVTMSSSNNGSRIARIR